MLWRSVLGQAVRDIFSSNPEEREEAILWMGTDDFLVICELSQVEPDNMREQMASLARMPMALARKYGLLLKTEIMRGIHHD